MKKKLALVFLLIAASLFSGKTSSHAEGDDLKPLTECLERQHSLSALFLVDTSQSLVKTDPRAERVAGLQASLASLSALKSSGGDSTGFQVFTEFLEFGSTSRRAFPGTPAWQALSDDPGEQAAIAHAFADKNKSEDTDYVAALDPWADPADPARPVDEIGAMEMLRMAPEGSCRLVIWFTDGLYEIDYQGHPKELHWAIPPIPINSDEDGRDAKGPAVGRLCDPGGLADEFRTGDITTGAGAEVAVVALDTKNADFDLIRAVAEGQGSGGPCGVQPSRGTFVSAKNIAQLVFGLREAVLGKSDGSSTGETGVTTCEKTTEPCDKVEGQIQNFDYSFDIANGITGFNLLALSGDPAVDTFLISPDQSEYQLKSSENTTLANGAQVQVQTLDISGGGYLVNATLPADRGGWQGRWRIRFRTSDGSKIDVLNRASIYVFGSVKARLEAIPLRRGATGHLVVSLVSAADQPTTDAVFKKGSTLELTVNDSAVDAPPVNANGEFVLDYPVPKDFAADSIDVAATLNPVIQLAADAPFVPLAPWSDKLGQLMILPPDVGAAIGSTGVATCDMAAADCVTVGDIGAADYPFDVSGALTHFNLLAVQGDPAVETSIVAPDGSEHRLTTDETTTFVPGVELTVHSLPTRVGAFYVQAAVSAEATTQAGVWRLRFRTNDPAKISTTNTASVDVEGAVVAQLTNPDLPLRKNREGQISISLATPGGQPLSASAFRAGSSLEIKVNGVVVPTTDVHPDGTFLITYDVAKDFPSDALDITATLTPTIQLDSTAPFVTLPTWTGSLGSIIVLPVPKHPIVDPAAPFVGELDQKHRDATTTIHIDASDPEAGGCVSLESLGVPKGAGLSGSIDVALFDGDHRIAANSDCPIKMEPGQSRDLTLKVSADHATFSAKGVLEGVVALRSTSDLDPSESELFKVGYSPSVNPITNTINNTSTKTALMLIAILLPFLLLYVANFFAGRLDVGTLTYASIPVRFSNSVLSRRDGGLTRPLVLDDTDLKIGGLPAEGRYRSVTAGSVELSGKIPLSPFADVYGQAEAGGELFVVSSRGSAKRGRFGRLGASLSRTWVFHSPALPVKNDGGIDPLDGELLLLVPPVPHLAQQQLIDDSGTIVDRIDSVARSLAVPAPAAPEPPQSTSPDPSFPSAPRQQHPPIPDVETRSAAAPALQPWETAIATPIVDVGDEQRRGRSVKAKKEKAPRAPKRSRDDDSAASPTSITDDTKMPWE